MSQIRRTPAFRLVAVLTLVALLAACRSTQVPPISSVGGDYEPFRDERRLWDRAREEEKKLRDNVVVYRDPLLVDYLEELVAHLNPPEMAANPQIGYRVTVVEAPTLNAFAYPHGSLYVHTGLLARMENEAQLATVLGHEMTHVENRHTLRHVRSARNKQLGFGIAAIAAAVVLAGEEGEALREGQYGKAARIDVLGNVLVALGLQLAFLAAVNGYSRDLEREADEGAFRKLSGGGYDVREAPKVYAALQKEFGESGKTEVFFFGSHPKLANRIDSANSWLAEHAGLEEAAPGSLWGPDGRERFERRMRPVIRDDAALNIESGRLELADFELQKVLGMMPDDPETHYLIGLLRLKQANQAGDPVERERRNAEARDALREAIRLDSERPLPHRELGLMAYRAGDYSTACVQFRHYVELADRAEDVARIRDYVLELERGGHCPQDEP